MKSFRLLVAFPVLVWYGCATAPTPAEEAAMSADDVRLRLSRTDLSTETFFADGSITVNTPTMTQSAGFEISSRGMDSLKMSVYGPFGITVGTALFAGEHVSAYNALNNTLYRGSLEKQLRTLPLVNDLPRELFFGALRGFHHIRLAAAMDSFSMQAGRSYIFSQRYDNGTYDSFEYDEETNRITACTRRDAEGIPLWIVRYAYRHDGNGSIIPEQVEVEIPAKEWTLLLEYGDVDYRPASIDFRLSVPDDAEVVTIE